MRICDGLVDNGRARHETRYTCVTLPLPGRHVPSSQSLPDLVALHFPQSQKPSTFSTSKITKKKTKRKTGHIIDVTGPRIESSTR